VEGHGEVGDAAGIVVFFLSTSRRAAGVLWASGASDGEVGIDSLRRKASQGCQGVRLREGKRVRLVRGCGVQALSQNRGFATAGSAGSNDEFLWHGGDSSEKKEGKLEREGSRIRGRDRFGHSGSGKWGRREIERSGISGGSNGRLKTTPTTRAHLSGEQGERRG
jgi:hypothetical protein